jgi:HAD superfamily hydrolase (TIGR01459 family)
MPPVASDPISQPIPQPEGLEAIASQYDALIIDLWGVLHDGIQAYEHAAGALKRLKEAGVQLCLLSNVPRREAPTVEKLAGMGLTPDLYDHLVTSGEATRKALIDPPDDWHEALGGTVYALAPLENAVEMLEGTARRLTDRPETASFLLAIGTSHVDQTMDDFRPALDAGLARGLPLLCANPDLIVNAGRKLALCAGSFAAYYREQGGNVAYHGKPHAPIYAECRKRLGLDEEAKVLAVGDSMATDVTGARNAGLAACLITSGIHLDDLGGKFGEAASPQQLTALADKYRLTPQYALPLFRW